MSTFLHLKKILYEQLAIPGGAERRKLLINEMEKLTQESIHCQNCTGICCTFSANSMQITPLEAFEIILSQEVTKDTVAELENKLQQNIQNYRLDHEVYLGKKNHLKLRKTYTCPFFAAGSKGCSIKKSLKPYGCLSFNPRILNDNGTKCHLDIDLLKKRELLEIKNEKEGNDFLRNELQIDWIKAEIPKAVLAIIENNSITFS